MRSVVSRIFLFWGLRTLEMRNAACAFLAGGGFKGIDMLPTQRNRKLHQNVGSLVVFAEKTGKHIALLMILVLCS